MICHNQAASFIARHNSWKKKETTLLPELLTLHYNLSQGANSIDFQIEDNRNRSGDGYMDSDEHTELADIAAEMRKEIQMLEIEANNLSLEHEHAKLEHELAILKSKEPASL